MTFAKSLLTRTLEGFPKERMALHICRGNWSRDESVALTGPYTPLLGLLQEIPVGTYLLEMATPRAGELKILNALPQGSRLGLGCVNQKLDRVESVAEIEARILAAIDIFGIHRLTLNPDCGFATFADNPLASAEVAEQKLKQMSQAANNVLERYGMR